MTALSAARNTKKYNPDVAPELISVPVAASTRIYQGSLVGIDANGRAVAGVSVASSRILGQAIEESNNSAGAAGDKSVRVRMGVFYFANSSSTDAITAAHVGMPCYAVDDDQVALTSNSGARRRAGIVVEVSSTDGVAVWLGSQAELSPACDLFFIAGEDLSTYQFSAVKRATGDNTVTRAGAGEFAIGVLQNAPANGAVAHVRVAGVTTMKADGTGVTRGDRISCAANGLARATAAAASGTAHVNTSDAGAATDPVIGANVIGIALSTAAASANTTVLLTHSGLVPTTTI